MEEDGNVLQDGAPPDQAPSTDPASAVPTTTKMEKVLSIEEAKAVTMSLLTTWSQDQLQKREIQSFWPIINSNLPRGALQPSSHPSIRTPIVALQEGSTAAAAARGGGGRGRGASTSRKRPRTEPKQQQTTTTTTYDISFPILEDGTLVKPSISGVSPAAIERLTIEFNKTCGECEICIAKAAGHFDRTSAPACPTLKAVKSWETQFGFIPYSLAKEISQKLAQPLVSLSQVIRKIPRVGKGVRCELCRTCRAETSTKRKCKFVKALLTDTVPERFTPVLAEVRAATAAAEKEEEGNLPSSSTLARATAPSGAGGRGSGGPSNIRISLQQYIEQMPGMNNTVDIIETHLNLGPNTNRPTDSDDAGADEGIDDKDEDLRWITWAPFLSHPQARHYAISSANTASGGGLKSLSNRQQVAVFSKRLEVEPESLIEWVCTARVVEGVDAVPFGTTAPENNNGASGSGSNTAAPTPALANKRNKVGAANKDPPAPILTECGHMNGRNMFYCESCGTVRWDGPIGQLRTRIISALQSGILIGAAGRTAADINTELAATVAARIAAEAGPGADMLPQIDELMNEVYIEVQRVRAERGGGGGAGAASVGRSQKEKEEEELRVIGSIARSTQMAQSVVTLQNAVSRLVEEQTGIVEIDRAKKRQKRSESSGEERRNFSSINYSSRGGEGGDSGVSNLCQKRMEELLQLRSLLIEANEHPLDWEGAAAVVEQGTTIEREAAARTTTTPSSSRRQRSGTIRGGVSGSTRPSFLGYSAFAQRIVNCLSGRQAHGAPGDTTTVASMASGTPASMTGYPPLCELLFTSAPPLSSSPSIFTSQGWTEALIVLLENLLGDVEATKQLMLASQIGGSGSLFRHVLWALLQQQHQKQEEKRRENASGADTADAQGNGKSGGGCGGGGGRRQNESQLLSSQQPNPFLIPTQQSQPDAIHPLSQSQPLSQPLSQSQQGTAGAGLGDVSGTATLSTAGVEAQATYSAWNSSIVLLDDLINGTNSPCTIINSTDTTTTVEEERQDQYRLSVTRHITSTTLQFVYGLTHSVLSAIAQKEAKERIPAHLFPFSKTILEYARFPEFPPLPPPPPLFLSEDHHPMQTDRSAPNRFDIHDIVKPVPDSRTPVQSMIKGVLPRKGRLPLNIVDQVRESKKQPPQARSGAFSVWRNNTTTTSDGGAEGSSDAGRDARGGGEIERDGQQQQQAVYAELIKQCPADVQLVFAEAIKSGVRPELVYKAVSRYLETVALGKEKDG